MRGNGIHCPECGRKLVWEHDPNGDSFGECRGCDEITDDTVGDEFPHPRHPMFKESLRELQVQGKELEKALGILFGMGFDSPLGHQFSSELETIAETLDEFHADLVEYRMQMLDAKGKLGAVRS